MTASQRSQDGEEDSWMSLVSEAAFRASQDAGTISPDMEMVTLLQEAGVGRANSTRIVPATQSASQAVRQMEEFLDADFVARDRPWGDDAFLASPRQPGAASNDDFAMLEHDDAQSGTLSLPTLNDDDSLPSRERDTTTEDDGGWFDVAECAGSSPGDLDGRPASSLPRGELSMPVLVRRSVGIPGQPDVLVCTLCGYALAYGTWAAMGGHWRHRGNHGVPPELKERARGVFEEARGEVFTHAEQWIPPSHPIPPIEGVPVLQAYRCGVAHCPTRFVLASQEGQRGGRQRAWREHHRRRHSATEFGQRGRPPVASAMVTRADNVNEGHSNDAEGPWGPIVQVQRLFARRPLHEVCLEPSPAPDRPAPTATSRPATRDSDAEAHFERLWGELEQRQAAEEKAHAAIIPAAGSFTVDEWHRYMDFVGYLHGFEWNRARKAADAPGQDASTLQRWVHLTAHVTVLKCYQMTKNAGQWVRQKVMQRARGEAPQNIWTGYIDPRAAIQHAKPLVACVDYWSATHLDAAAQRAVPAYVRHPDVERAWTLLIEHARAMPEASLVVPMSTRFLEEGGVELTAAELLMLNLILALLDQQASINERQELPIIGALLVQGIVPGRSPTFRRAGEFSRSLASFMKMARGVVGASLLLYKEREDYTAVIESHLVRGPNNAMNWIGITLCEAMKIDRKTPNERTQLTWQPAREAFLLGDHDVSRDDMVGIVHGALEEAREVLCKELLFVAEVAELPAVPWKHMVDRPSERKIGYSCWTERANMEALREGRAWHKAHMRTAAAAGFVKDRNWSDTAIVKFGRARQRFQAASLTLFTWVVGPSIRGRTVSSYQWRNTVENPRNLVLSGDRLMLTGGWHKNLRRGTSAALHVLPEEVADLWGWYLWLVWPFWDTIRRRRGMGGAEQMGNGDELLFQNSDGTSMHSSYISECLKRASRRVVSPGFGLQEGRQLVSGFVRKFIPPEALGGGEAWFIDHYERSSRTTTERAAAIVSGGSGIAANDLPEDSVREEDPGDGGCNVADLPVVDLAGDARAPAPVESSSLLRFDEMRRVFSSRSAIATTLGHSTGMDRLRYANDVNAIPGTDDLAVQLWSLVSHHWHLVLRIPSALRREHARLQRPQQEVALAVKRERGPTKRRSGKRAASVGSFTDSTPPRSGSSSSSSSSSGSSLKRARRETSQPALLEDVAGRLVASRRRWRRLLQDFVQERSADFRDVQWPALKCIVGNSKSSTLVIAPTGGGKTALIALPAMLPNAGVTMVVVPLCALRDQLFDRCRRAAIRCALWTADGDMNLGMLTQASIVIVMAEHLEMSAFKQWTRTLCAQRRLDRIVVDEVHIPLITNLNWRPALKDLGTLATYGVPLVMLTATLPPTMEPKLLEFMHMTAVRPQVFRSSTVRRNITYSVLWVEDKLSLEERSGGISWSHLAELVEGHRRRSMRLHRRQRSKMIVFCEDKDGIRELVKLLPNASAYYRDAPNAAAELDAFRAASDGILCATSAVSHGLDDPTIDDVVHVTIPDDLLQYLQQAGRAARLGQPGTAVLIAGRGVRLVKPKTQEKVLLRRAMGRYIQHRHEPGAPALQCRRRVIDEEMDGDGRREQCRPEVGELLCDVCMARQLELTCWSIPSSRKMAQHGHGRGEAAAISPSDQTSSPPPPSLGGQASAPVRETQYQASEATLSSTRRATPLRPSTPPYAAGEANALMQDPQDQTRVATPASTRWATPLHPGMATSPATGSATSYSGGYSSSRPDAGLSSPCIGRMGPGGVGSPRVPPMPRAPPANAATRERMTSFVQWHAHSADISFQQWRIPKERVRRMADFWLLHCGLHSLLVDERSEWSHTREDCSLRGTDQYRQLMGRVREINPMFQMQSYSGCFRCKMPQALCSDISADGRVRVCRRKWAHVVMDAWVVCTELSPRTREFHADRLRELRLSGDADVFRYLKAKVEVGKGTDRIETTRLVEWLVQLTEHGFTRVGKDSLGGF